jgi:phosphatidylserine/phosphatidylglycerophosphate/cardiolipin synthase-like enzyme
MNRRVVIGLFILSLVAGWSWTASSVAHQDPCHRLHSCPSDGHTYGCGDRGRCDQCPDNQCCLAGQPRPAASSPSTSTPPAPMPAQPSSPGGMTACFTPAGNCTDLIVGVLEEAKSSILVQAYSFTSAPIAKALLEAHKRGVRVEVILDKSQRTEKYSSADFLANQGLPTTIDTEHANADHCCPARE